MSESETSVERLLSMLLVNCRPHLSAQTDCIQYSHEQNLGAKAALASDNVVQGVVLHHSIALVACHSNAGNCVP